MSSLRPPARRLRRAAPCSSLFATAAGMRPAFSANRVVALAFGGSIPAKWAASLPAGGRACASGVAGHRAAASSAWPPLVPAALPYCAARQAAMPLASGRAGAPAFKSGASTSPIRQPSLASRPMRRPPRRRGMMQPHRAPLELTLTLVGWPARHCSRPPPTRLPVGQRPLCGPSLRNGQGQAPLRSPQSGFITYTARASP